MGKSKIDWTDEVWNPVWGCKTGCEYCYARKFAKRFGNKIARKEAEYVENYSHLVYSTDMYLRMQLRRFEPTWLESNFQKEFPRTPKKIFVGSMSDIFWWERKWMQRVLNKISKNPQHRFLFLTKFPEVYKKYDFPQNCWLGVTVNKTNEIQRIQDLINFTGTNIRFVSFEPLMEDIIPKVDLNKVSSIEWFIIGAETGNRKGKIIPKKKWVENFANDYIPPAPKLFYKDSIIKLFPDIKIYREFPENINGVKYE